MTFLVRIPDDSHLLSILSSPLEEYPLRGRCIDDGLENRLRGMEVF
jgi:hypothetical protein